MNIVKILSVFTIIAAVSLITGSLTTYATAETFTMINIEDAEKVFQATKPGIDIKITQTTENFKGVLAKTSVLTVSTFAQYQSCFDQIELELEQLVSELKTTSVSTETECGFVNMSFISFSSHTHADYIDEISVECSEYQMTKMDKALATGSVGDIAINVPNASIQHNMGLLKICMDSGNNKI